MIFFNNNYRYIFAILLLILISLNLILIYIILNLYIELIGVTNSLISNLPNIISATMTTPVQDNPLAAGVPDAAIAPQNIMGPYFNYLIYPFKALLGAGYDLGITAIKVGGIVFIILAMMGK